MRWTNIPQKVDLNKMRYALASLLLLCLIGFAPGTTAHDQAQSLTAAEIISKHLEAVGGKATLAKFKSRIAIGTVKKENDPGIQMAIVSEAPNRVSGVYVFSKYNWQLTYDGKKTIVRPLFPRAYAEIQTKFEEMLASGLMFNSISLYNSLTEQGLLTNVEAERFDKEVAAEVEEAIEFAESSPEPPLDSLYENVFS